MWQAWANCWIQRKIWTSTCLLRHYNPEKKKRLVIYTEIWYSLQEVWTALVYLKRGNSEMKLRGENYSRDKKTKRFQEVKWFWGRTHYTIISSSLQHFWHEGQVSWKTISPWTGEGAGRMVFGWFKCTTCTVHFISITIISTLPQIIKH